jgi:hypothetical protein
MDKAQRAASVKTVIEFIRETGAYVFPVRAGAKTPAIKDNLLAASDSPKQILAWESQFPGCNWGLSLAKSKLIAVDVDTKDGKAGGETYFVLDLKHGWPATRAHHSPSGGRHYLYRGKHVFALGERGFGNGVDSPGYILIPPSTIRGIGDYAVSNDAPIADAPEWFGAYLYPPAAHERNATPAVHLDKPQNIEWAADYIKRDAPHAIEGHGGELTTFKVACELRDHGISEPKACEMMQEFYNVPGRCDPLWDYDDLVKKIANAYCYASINAPGAATAENEFAGEPNPFPTAVVEAAAVERAEEDQPRPIVTYRRQGLPEIAREVAAILARRQRHPTTRAADVVYRRGAELIHLNRHRVEKPIEGAGPVHDRRFHADDDLLLVAVQPDWLHDVTARNVRFVQRRRIQSGKSAPMEIAPPDALIKRIMSLGPADWPFRSLNGTTETPFLRLDGTVCATPGYDTTTGIYFDPATTDFPAMRDNPTRDDALVALSVLDEMLVDFPFSDEDDQVGLSHSVALAMLLTAVCRRSLPTAPMFGVDADNAETGKTTLAQAAAILMTGREAVPRPWSRHEEERRKMFGAAFSAGDPVLLFDDVDANRGVAIEGGSLNAVITDRQFKDRRLGGNTGADQIGGATNALMLTTANKLIVAGDTAAERILICKMHTDAALSARTFQHRPFNDWLKRRRPSMVIAALTILRAHALAISDQEVPTGRHYYWGRLVGDALVWLGLPDPLLAVDRAKASDPTISEQRAIVRAWAQYIGDAEATTSEALKFEAVRKAIADHAERSPAGLSARMATFKLRAMANVPLIGYRLAAVRDKRAHTDRWRLICIDEAQRIEPEETPATASEFDPIEE